MSLFILSGCVKMKATLRIHLVFTVYIHQDGSKVGESLRCVYSYSAHFSEYYLIVRLIFIYRFKLFRIYYIGLHFKKNILSFPEIKFYKRKTMNKSTNFVLQVGFEFHSSQLDIVESFWRFTIPSQDINLPFLLVGNTKEPDICMDRSHLNFKALLVGKLDIQYY